MRKLLFSGFMRGGLSLDSPFFYLLFLRFPFATALRHKRTPLWKVMSLPNFIVQLDKKQARAIGVTLFMFALVVAMILMGRYFLDVDESQLKAWLASFADSVWALPITIVLFCAAAFFGVPQWLLIGAAVFAFGPLSGFLYSWVSTMLSASLNFWLGRVIGAERLESIGGSLVGRIIRLVRKNGFVTSFTVRLVPTGPFVLVNMAAGVSKMTFPAFLAGTGLGILPKIAAVAFLGQSLMGALRGNGWVFVAGLAGFILSILAVMIFARTRLKAREEGASLLEDSLRQKTAKK